jgi:hypothetical protein
MSGFGTLWRTRTRKHIRTRHSIPTNTGSGRSLWPGMQETEYQRRETERLQARRRLHEQRQNY